MSEKGWGVIIVSSVKSDAASNKPKISMIVRFGEIETWEDAKALAEAETLLIDERDQVLGVLRASSKKGRRREGHEQSMKLLHQLMAFEDQNDNLHQLLAALVAMGFRAGQKLPDIDVLLDVEPIED